MPSSDTWRRSNRLDLQRIIQQIRNDLHSESSSSSDAISIQNASESRSADERITREEETHSSDTYNIRRIPTTIICELTIYDLILHHNYSKSQARAAIDVINKLMQSLQSEFRLDSIDKIWRKATSVIEKEYYFLCENSHSHGPFVGEPKNFHSYHCQNRDYPAKLATGNYLIKLSLRKQLELILPSISEHIIEANNANSIHSIMDGASARNARAQSSCLTITICSDEVPVSKSSKMNAMPFYVLINELDSKSRNENVLLFSVFVGRSKPSCANSVLDSMISELRSLERIPVIWKSAKTSREFCKTFKLVCFIADAPMRAYLRSVKQFSSRFGCDWCKIEGIHDSYAMKFPSISLERMRLLTRSRNDFIMYAQGHANDIATAESIKKNSEFLKMEIFDIVWGFSVDLMHSVFLGVIKDVFRRGWFNPIYRHKPYSLLDQGRIQRINNRIKCIKISSDHVRPIRNLEEYKDWKANEFASFILYFCYPVLIDILPSIYVAHLTQLAEALMILCDTIHDTASIDRAEYLLHEFNINLEKLYGFEFLTYNSHIIIHLAECVRKQGPLIPSSAFLSENKMGQMKKNSRKYTDLPQTLANLHLIKLYRSSMDSTINDETRLEIIPGKSKNIAVPIDLFNFCHTSRIPVTADTVSSLHSIRIDGKLFTTREYDMNFKRCNSCIMNADSAYIIEEIYFDRISSAIIFRLNECLMQITIVNKS